MFQSELEELRSIKEKELEILAARIESWPVNAGSGGEPQLAPLGPVLLLVSVWVQKNNNVCVDNAVRKARRRQVVENERAKISLQNNLVAK